MSSALKSIAKRLPGIREIVAERDQLRRDCGIAPPGHFYSPIPSLAEIARDDSKIFNTIPRTIPGIELHESEQLELLEEFCKYYPTIPFPANKQDGLRYYYENPSYSYSDAIFLHCMIRHLKPKRIIEIGSGFSSCATLDTNQVFFNGSIRTTFVEPYPDSCFRSSRRKIKSG